MARPRHIQQQIDEGKAAFEANLRGEQIPDAPDPLAAQVGGLHEPEPVFDQSGQTPIPLEEPPGEEPSPQGEPPPEPHEEPGSIGDDDLARSRHAAASWKGRANAARAEAAKLAEQVSELTGLVNRQLHTMTELAARVGPASPSSAEPKEPEFVPPTSEERQHYGEEFSSYIERTARAAMQRELDEIQSRIGSVSGVVDRVDKRSHQQMVKDFYTDLRSRCPTYEEIDADPAFGEWLQQTDQYSGEARKKLLANASGVLDSARAAHFFLGFLAEQEATRPRTNLPTPGAAGSSGDDVLRRLASPGRARQPATREAPAPEKISAQTVKTFYSDVTKGKYKSRPDEKADMVRRIEAALLSGNLTQQ